MSQEVIRCSSVKAEWQLVLFRSWVELEESVFHELVNLHDGGLVSTAVAVVGCREDRDDVAVVRPVVSIHDQLMRTRDQLQVV